MKSLFFKLLLATMILSLLSACGPAATAPPQETVIETVVVEREGETVIVTATPEPKELQELNTEQRTWLEAAQLGPYTPETQDWDAIEAAAKEEGQVVIYSVSSRIFKLQDEFMEKYGVEIVAFDLASEIQLEKLRREHRAGIYEVDVLFNADTPTLLGEFLPQRLIWNFIPDSVVPELEPEELEPLLVQRWTSRVLFYNQGLLPEGAPIDSLWDLTREEWSGKFIMPDPLENATQMNMIQTIMQHADEMEVAYEAEFGEAITYSEGVFDAVGEIAVIDEPNASMEWLYRVLQNDPAFLTSTTTIYNNIGDMEQEEPPVGITTFSKLREWEDGVYEAAPAYDVKPVFGVSYPTVLVIADRAPHPNAAKLLVRYMMEEGFWPWDEPGDYSSRTSVVEEQVEKYGIPTFEEANLWPFDEEYIYDNKYTFLSLYLELK
jgi:iron(III) transport system substrate-binding protein